MVDSDLDNDLFGDSEESQEEQGDLPAYFGTNEYTKFCEKEGINAEEELGFVQLQTFKPYYFSG